MGFETPNPMDMRNWSVAEWKNHVMSADKDKKLAFFNDVISGREAPVPEQAKHLVLQNVVIGGKLCDVYHWDQENGKKRPHSTVNRVFVHVKESY